MLNLNGSIEGKIGKFLVHGAGNAQCVSWSVPEVGVAESDVTGSLGNLGTDICQHNFARDGKEATTIDRRDRTMQAGMFATACRLSIARQTLFPVPFQACILAKIR